VNNWTAAEILLGAAVLVLAMPREDGFVIPERRDWLGWLKGLRPRVRRQREEDGGREADRYVTALRAEPVIIRQDQLPSLHRAYQGPVVTRPTVEQERRQRPPWQAAAAPVPPPARGVPGRKPRRRAPGDPPTVVIEVMRPAISGDLGTYLAELPAYTDLDDDSEDAFFVPRSSIALGAPDHDGTPQHVDDDEAEEDDLAPLQRGVKDVEVELQEGREKGSGDRQL
jgi:hypothetical protein